MDADVLIVGAGPVGLLLANLLGRAGFPVLVLEKRETRADTSRAIGVTRTSLQILQELGLAEALCLEGREVSTAVLHAGDRLLRRVEIRRPPGELPFIVSLPQYRTERLLLGSLGRFPSVRLLTGHEVDAVAEEDGVVRAGATVAAGLGRAVFRARFLCACDGDSSTVRRLLGVPRAGRAYTASFLMGDYLDRSGLGGEAHLFFTPEGSVESFPVGHDARRWIAQESGGEEPLEAIVRRRTGFEPDPRDLLWGSRFRPERTENRRFHCGRIVFCGDAAHTMPPIGGHGMNSGFGDAHLLARVLERALREGVPGRPAYHARLLAAYGRYRRRAFRATALRSRLFMGVGTMRAPLLRPLRNLLVRLLLLPPLRGMVVRHFAMLNIPFATVRQVARRARFLKAPARQDAALADRQPGV